MEKMSDDKLDIVKQQLDAIQSGVTTLNILMKPTDDNPENQPILVASKVLIDSLNSCIERMNSTYKKYNNEIVKSGTKMVNSLNKDFQTVLDNIKNTEEELDKYQKDREIISPPIDEYSKRNHKEPRLCFQSDIEHSYEFDVELMKKYPGSYFWNAYMNPQMWTIDGDINIEHSGENYDYILKYMKNIIDDDNLVEDLKNMDFEKRKDFVDDLDFLSLPVIEKYMNELCFDDDKVKMEAWKKRMIIVNGKNVPHLNIWLKKNGLFDNLFNKNNIESIQYHKENNIIYVNMKLKYREFIEDYCKKSIMNGDLLVILYLKYEDILNELKSIGMNVNEKEVVEAWKKNRYIYINNEYKENVNNWIKKLDLFKDMYYDNKYKQVIVNAQNIIYINIILKFVDFIENYCKSGEINEDLISKEGNEYNFDYLQSELKQVGIQLNEEEKKDAIQCFFSASLLLEQTGIVDKKYDEILKKWLGFQYKWKLIYRASEHECTAMSFHDCCDNKGPTLVIIKSSKGWIFGGYTSKSWKIEHPNHYGYEYKDDSDAFIFTLKNPHHVPPTKYNKLKDSPKAIYCSPHDGPSFFDGRHNGCDIFICNECDKKKDSSINNDGEHGYECNSEYKKSLFVGRDENDKSNARIKFLVYDYEVFSRYE